MKGSRESEVGAPAQPVRRAQLGETQRADEAASESSSTEAERTPALSYTAGELIMEDGAEHTAVATPDYLGLVAAEDVPSYGVVFGITDADSDEDTVVHAESGMSTPIGVIQHISVSESGDDQRGEYQNTRLAVLGADDSAALSTMTHPMSGSMHEMGTTEPVVENLAPLMVAPKGSDLDSALSEREEALSHAIDRGMFGYKTRSRASTPSAGSSSEPPAPKPSSFKLKNVITKHKGKGGLLSPRGKKKKRKSLGNSLPGSPLGVSKIPMSQYVPNESSEGSSSSSSKKRPSRVPNLMQNFRNNQTGGTQSSRELDLLLNVVEKIYGTKLSHGTQRGANTNKHLSMHMGNESSIELTMWHEMAQEAGTQKELLEAFVHTVYDIFRTSRERSVAIQKCRPIVRDALAMQKLNFVLLFRDLAYTAEIPAADLKEGKSQEGYIPYKRVLEVMTGMDFTSGFKKNARSGELFLHLCALISEHKKALPMGFRLENITFDRTNIKELYKIATAPLHLLMVLKQCGDKRDRHNSTVLLKKTIKYINEACDDASAKYEKDRELNERDGQKEPHRFSGAWVFERRAEMVFCNAMSPKTVALSHPTAGTVSCLQDYMDGLQARVVDDTTNLTNLPDMSHFSTFIKKSAHSQICAKCGIVMDTHAEKEVCAENTEKEKGQHTPRKLVDCSPLRFAVQLRQTDTVEQILGTDSVCNGVVSRDDDWISGKCSEDDNDRFTCERFVDVWNASGTYDLFFVNEESFSEDGTARANPAQKEISPGGGDNTPVLHFLLRSIPSAHEYLKDRMLLQGRPPNVYSRARIWPASYSPQSRGGYDEDVPPEIRSALDIAELLLLSCTYDRKVETRDGSSFISVREPAQILSGGGMFIKNSQLRSTAKDYKITKMYDRCGLYRRCDHTLGISLLLQVAPEKVQLLFEQGHMMFSPYDWLHLNFILSENFHKPPALLLQYRHLWRASRLGVELLVYDSELTMLHWLCLIGNASILATFFKGFDFKPKTQKDQMMECLFSRTSKLGWTPVHYAVYANSLDCLAFIMDVAKRHFGSETLKFVADAPSYVSAGQLGGTMLGAARQFLGTETNRELLTPEHMERIEVKVIKDATFDPSSEALSPRPATALYGSISSAGLTPLHICSMFCHQNAMDILLECSADPRSRTFLEEMDPHDVAVALHARMKLQYEIKRQTERIPSNEQKTHDENEEVIRSSINRLHSEEGVKRKLARIALWYSTTSVLPHVILCALLFAYISFTRSSSDFYSTNAMDEGVLREEFIHEKNVSLQVFTDIGELDELKLWLTGTFYHQLFPEFNVSAGLFLGYWELVGSIRMTQVRGQFQENCEPPDWWFSQETPENVRSRYKNKCYGPTEEEVTGSWVTDIPYLSRLTGEYWFLVPGNAPNSTTTDVPNRPDDAEIAIGKFASEIDYSTRAAIVWFIAYNPSVNSFAVVTALVEFPLEGAAYPHWEVSVMPERLFFLSSSEIVFYVFFSMYLLMYLLYYTAEELMDAFSAKTVFATLRRANTRRGLGEDEAEQTESPQPSPPSSPLSGSLDTGGPITASNPLLQTNINSAFSPTDTDPSQHLLSGHLTAGTFSGKHTTMFRTKTAQKKEPKREKASKRDEEKRIRNDTMKQYRQDSEVVSVVKNLFEVVYLYLAEDWNFLDMLCLISIYVGLYTHIMLLTKRTDVQNELLDEPPFEPNGEETEHFFSSFVPFKDWVVQQNTVVAIVLILHLVKLLKYAQLLPVVGPVISAIVKTSTSKNVAVFLLVWQFLTVVFIFGFNVIFGSYIEGYKSLYDSFFTVQRHVLSDFDDFNKYYTTHTKAGPLLWLILTYICHLLLLNLFIAVISVDYVEVLGKATEDWSWKLLEKYKQRDLRLVNPSDSASMIVWFQVGRALRMPYFMRKGYNIKDVIIEKKDYETQVRKDPSALSTHPYRHLRDWNVIAPRVIDDLKDDERDGVKRHRGHAGSSPAHSNAVGVAASDDAEDSQPRDRRAAGGGRLHSAFTGRGEDRDERRKRRLSVTFQRARTPSNLSSESGQRFNRSRGSTIIS